MTYQDQMRAHLGAYKANVLGISAPGIFRHEQVDLPMEHILPLEHADLNLLEPAREIERSYRQVRVDLKRHRFFHHLNSSQAFAFNLFFPYFEGGVEASAVLLRALGQPGEELASWEPESVPDANEETNLDATWLTRSGVRTFCEVKLTEGEVGSAAADDRHRAKLLNIYGPILSPHLAVKALEAALFFKNYQIWRNLWHVAGAGAPGRLLFLLPRANKSLWRQVSESLDLVTSPLRLQVRMVGIEDVLISLAADSQAPASLKSYPAALIAKYLP